MPLIIILWIALLSTVTNTYAQGVDCANSQAQIESPLCVALGKLNGHWYSEKWKYGYELTNGVGVATSSNSNNFKVGDKIIRLIPTGSNTFSGEQVYTDGKFYKIDVKLGADGSLVFAGEKNISWVMTRTASTNSAGTKPQTPTANQQVAPPNQSSGNNTTNIVVNSTPQGSTVPTPPTARQPTDAQSYCDKVASSPVADRISKKYVVVRGKLSELFELSGKNSSDPALARFIGQTRRAFTLGFDDESRSKTKLLVKRLNDAIPKKDAYNQDIAVLNYMPWFAACANTFKDSALKFIFLDPSDNKALAAFYGSAPSARNTKLQELWEAPNLGGLYDRRIQEKVGLASMGINPLWVTPMLFLSADGTLTAEANEAEKRLDSLVSQLNTHIATLKADMQAFSSPNNQSPPVAQGQPVVVTSSTAPVSNFNEYCQRLTSNPEVKKLVAGLAAEGRGSIFLKHTYLDNKNRDLEKWVAKNMITLMGPQGNYYDKIDWVNKCIIRERNTDLFMLSFSPDDYRPGDPQWYEKHRLDADKAAERLSRPGASTRGNSGFKAVKEDDYPQLVKSGKLGGDIRDNSGAPRDATLLAFLFPGAEEMVKKTSLEAITPKQANDAVKAEKTALAEKKMAENNAKAEAELMPLRNLVTFSKSKGISSSFQVCVKSETKYFENVISKEADRLVNIAVTVAEQQEIKTAMSRWRKNMPAGIEAYCINRLLFSMRVVLQGVDVARRISGIPPNEPNVVNLESTYTSTAIDAIQKKLQNTPEMYRKESMVGTYDSFFTGLSLFYLNQLLDERGKFGFGTWK